MKRMSHIALGLLLILSLTTSAFAAEVPEDFVIENLNGQQRLVKTYVLPPRRRSGKPSGAVHRL